MASIDNFCPFGSDSTAVSVSSVTANGALNLPSSSTDLSNPVGGTRSSNMGGISVRVYNSTSVVVFIQFGGSGTTSTTSKTPIPPGGVEIFQIGPSVTTIAGI